MPDHVFTVDEIQTVIREVASRYGVEKIVLFGSYARGEATLNSDIDLRIEKGQIRGLFQLSGFQLDLEERFKTHVDLITTDSLDDKFLRRIQKEEIVLYEQ